MNQPPPRQEAHHTMFNDLGRSSRILASLYRNLSGKLAALTSHCFFMTVCATHGVVPFGLRLGIQPTCERERLWKERAERERAKAAHREFRCQLYTTKARLSGILGSLERRGLRPEQLDLLRSLAKGRYNVQRREYDSAKAKKLDRLLAEKGPLNCHAKGRALKFPQANPKTVINISSTPLSDAQANVLGLGLKFAPPPKQLPVLEMAAKSQLVAETAARHSTKLGTTDDQIAQFLNTAETTLTSASRVPFPRLPRHLDTALSELRKDQDRVTISADKAKSVVVLDRTDYEAALLRALTAPTYEEVPADPAEKYARDFNTKYLLTAFAGPPVRGGGNRLRQLGEEEKKLYGKLAKTHGRCGAFYAQAKTHKHGSPPATEEERLVWTRTLKVRPINPGYRSVDYELAKHLTSCLQALPRPANSINGPAAVLEMLSSWGWKASQCQLISLDVCAMFPSINTTRAVSLIRRLLHTHSELLSDVTLLSPDAVADLLHVCIANTHTVVQAGGRERFFVQRRGLAMGKSFSPVVADLAMGEWEADLKDLARQSGGAVLDFVRYADDYLALWDGNQDQLDVFLALLNDKDPDIQVELEREVGGRLPFLDILIQRDQESFKTSVFRKASNSGQVTPFASFTHPRYLQAAIRSDATRAWRYSSSLALRQKEVDRLKHQYASHGFPATLVHREITRTFASLELKKRALPAPQDPDETRPIRVSFPYTGNSFHQLRRAASPLGIQLVCKPMTTLGSQLASRAKHRLPETQQSGLVYAIRCSCQTNDSPAVYVGETDRELGVRTKEHEDGWRKGSRTSAFGAHAGCQPDFEGVSILAHQSHRRLRLLYESAFIRVAGRRQSIIVSPNDASVNRNSGLLFDQRWLPLVSSACQLPAPPTD